MTIYICFIFLISITLNIGFLVPKKHSESISLGYYVSRDQNGIFYKLSIMNDNKVLLYGTKDNLLFEGKLELNEKENNYLIKTESNTYQVAVRDDVIFLPIIENDRIVSKLFTKVGNVPVTYGKE
ncbi:hypothetical protein [Candidatus Clostridium stratigraminis]|uniref:NusG domain-containing protein n=1 Tax=Candidatus Clostridium stratigraminis TaxID=3381661 RepID=A0ABW8T470_9CLOT